MANWKTYRALLRHWLKMFAKDSYWHLEQGLGKQFRPGLLRGYFNDLSGKVQWNGPVDEAGLPINRTQSGQVYHFPTTLFQKALGHFDVWLQSGETAAEHRSAFLQIADWALLAMDIRGGWNIWKPLGLSFASPYSAMTQGEGISVLVRAYSMTSRPAYLVSACQAAEPLLAPVQEGGTAHRTKEGLLLEEEPHLAQNPILNGWIFAIFGLYDLTLLRPDEKYTSALEDSLQALLTYLDRYDAGFWSLYDLNGNLASPFYHRLHIAQLQALELAFPEHRQGLAAVRSRFDTYLNHPFHRFRAVAVKGYQKLRHPPQVVLE